MFKAFPAKFPYKGGIESLSLMPFHFHFLVGCKKGKLAVIYVQLNRNLLISMDGFVSIPCILLATKMVQLC